MTYGQSTVGFCFRKDVMMKRKYGYRKFKGIGLASAVIGFTLLSAPVYAESPDGGGGLVNAAESASTTPQPSGRIIARGEDGVPWELYENGYLLFKPVAGKDALQRGMWDNYKDRITSINFSGKVYAPENSDALFSTFNKMTYFDGSHFDTSRVTSMQGMFNYASALISLDVSNWKTGNVTDMKAMFQGASKLETLNVSTWDTSKVTNMSYMFSGTSSLTALNVRDWKTGNVTDMKAMFQSLSAVTTLDVSKWDTSRVTDMAYMFSGVSSLTSLNVSDWKTGNVTDMKRMFQGTDKLEMLDVSKWKTNNVTNMSSMFSGASSLTSLNVSKWDTSKVTDMSFMFSGASSLTSLDVSNWKTGNVTNMQAMFQSLSTVTTLDVSKWDTSRVTDMSYMFNGMHSMTALDISHMTWLPNAVTTNMFSGTSLLRITLPATPIPNHATSGMPKVIYGHMDRWSRQDGALQPYSWEELGTNWNSNMAGTWVRHDDSATITLTGEQNQPIVVHGTRDIPRPSVPKKNHRWVGWSRTQNGDAMIGAETILQPGEHLTLYPIWEKVDNVRTRTVTIPAETTYEGDDTIDYGKRSEVPGEDGEKRITTTYDVEDYTGRLINPVEDNGRVTKPMKPKVVKIGTKTKTETTPIAPKTVYRKDTSRAYGEPRMTTQGTPGSIVKTTTYEFDKTDMTVSSLTTTRTTPATDTIVNVAAADKIVDTPIAPNVRYEADTTRARGTRDERAEGTPGNRRTITTYDVNPDNGNVTERPGTPTVTRQPGTTVVRVGAADKVEKSNSVARTTRTIKDPTKPLGYRNVDKEGSDGYTETITHYNVNPTDGTVTERTETRTVPPVEQVITEGALAYDLPTTGTADMTVTLAGLAGTLVVTKRKKK